METSLIEILAAIISPMERVKSQTYGRAERVARLPETERRDEGCSAFKETLLKVCVESRSSWLRWFLVLLFLRLFLERVSPDGWELLSGGLRDLLLSAILILACLPIALLKIISNLIVIFGLEWCIHFLNCLINNCCSYLLDFQWSYSENIFSCIIRLIVFKIVVRNNQKLSKIKQDIYLYIFLT